MRLAKWEDRGYYAMKVSTERNQRQLHRLTRRAQEALSHPAAAVLAAASKAMGFADLADADLAPGGVPNQGDPKNARKLGSRGGYQEVLSPEQASGLVCVWLLPLSAVCEAGLSLLALLQLPTTALHFANRCKSQLGGEGGGGGGGGEFVCI